MIACAQIPRFALRVAARERLEVPAVLAPRSGECQVVGEVSAAAEAQGVRAGMQLGEALGHCPSLRLIAPDPARAAEIWERVLVRLEGIGAAVESERAGEAFFSIDGLRGLYGGEASGVLTAARRALGGRVRIAAAPNRFASAVAARRGARLPRNADGGEAIVPAGALPGFLAPLPIVLLGSALDPDPKAGELIANLQRLGLRTLGGLTGLSPDQVADRFGALGLRALRLARGEDTPLRPRTPPEELIVEIELAEGTAGPQLDRSLELLVERLLAAPKRKQRTLLALRLSARLCGGGSWSAEQGFGRPTGKAEKISPLLVPRLEQLPGAADQLRLAVLAFGPEAVDQLELSLDRSGPRQSKLATALREVRAAAGGEALLKVVAVDPRSRVPERRFLLAPYPER